MLTEDHSTTPRKYGNFSRIAKDSFRNSTILIVYKTPIFILSCSDPHDTTFKTLVYCLSFVMQRSKKKKENQKDNTFYLKLYK